MKNIRHTISLLIGIFFALKVSAFELKGLTLGASTSPDQVSSAMGVKCGEGANGMQVCNGPTTIGGVWGSVNIVISPTKQLQRIQFSFDEDSFDTLAEAFTEKYGKPKIERSVAQNAFGAKFNQTALTWSEVGGNQIHLSKNLTKRGSAFIWFSTKNDREMLGTSRKANKDDL
uniref:Uncharacterized protein n=1 Tax=biofilter metagenome TaxID=1070537 RepID=A0A1A7GDT3_9ZZZZ